MKRRREPETSAPVMAAELEDDSTGLGITYFTAGTAINDEVRASQQGLERYKFNAAKHPPNYAFPLALSGRSTKCAAGHEAAWTAMD